MADEEKNVVQVGQTPKEEEDALVVDPSNPVTPEEEAVLIAQNRAVEEEEKQLEAAGIPTQLGDALLGKEPQRIEAAEPPHSKSEALAETKDDHYNTSVFLGRTFPYPIYTVIFGVLAAATVIEILISGIAVEALRVPLLLGLAIIKALLVIYYYMHLRTDSRIFAVTLIIPTVVAFVAMMYLLFVPTQGY